MKEIVDKYIVKTNIWVSLCFMGLLGFFQLSFFRFLPSVWGIVFFGTLGVYNFTRLGDINRFNLKYLLKSKVFILTCMGLAGAFISLLIRGFEFRTLFYLGLLGFLSFLYVIPYKGIGLRYVPFLKLFLIGFVWAGSSVGLLLVVHHQLLQYQVLMLSIFCFVVGITIPFDIRDEKSDDRKLKTIPMVIGFKKAKLMSVILLFLSAFFFYLEFGEINLPYIAWLIALLFALILVLNTTKDKSHFYFSFWVESCSLIPLIAYGILNAI